MTIGTRIFAVFLVHSVVRYRVFLQFLFDKGTNVSEATEIIYNAYGVFIGTAYRVKLWFRRFRSDIFYVSSDLSAILGAIKNLEIIFIIA